MSRPVLQANLDDEMYLELLKLKADFRTGNTWATSSDWKERLVRFAQKVVIKSYVFFNVEILVPFDEEPEYPVKTKGNPPRRATAGTFKKPEDSKPETVEDYV